MKCNSIELYQNRGGNVSVSLEIKKKCVEMSESGMSNKQIFMDFYSKEDPTIGFESFRRSIFNWKTKEFPNRELLQKARLDASQIPFAATVQINGAGDVTQAWIRTKSNDAVYMKLIDTVQNVPPIPYRRAPVTVTNDRMLEIALYDMHFGINTLESYQETLDDILEILSRPFKKIVIVLGQDMFHNDDFMGRTSSGTPIQKIDMEKAWNDAYIFYCSIIMACNVNPDMIYSEGNHDASMGWAFIKMLKAKFPDLEVDDSRKDRKVVTYGTNVIGFTHGNKVRGKLINLRSIFSVEFPMEFAQAKVKEIHAGHLHHEKSEDIFGVMCRTLSTANETDEWHYDNGYVGQNKRFMVFEWSETKLKCIHYV